MTQARLRIAIQKSGRLSDESFNLLKHCGIKVRQYHQQLFCHCENFPLDILLVRDDDIPRLVSEGLCDYGIVGTNVLNEQPYDHIESSQYLEFGKCRLALAVPETFHYTDIKSLTNKRIATSYPNLLGEYLKQKNVEANIIKLNGCVEIAPRLGIADAICDLVSTGSTLEANNLTSVETIFNSQAVLIATNNLNNDPEKKSIAESFINRIQGVLQANEAKYIMLHAPKQSLSDIVSLLPGAEHPTIMQLEGDPNTVGIHAVCRENIFWDTLEKLKSVGASSILVLPVEKMMS